MFNKVLVLSASAGAGHLRAAEAVMKAFVELGAAGEVQHIDALEYTNKVFRTLYSKAYIELVNTAPDVLGWFYDQLDRPWKNERRRLALNKLNTRPFIKMLEEYQPDIAVCTHFLPAEIISWLKAKRRLHCRQAIVVTDFDVHAMWLCHHFEQYFVALDETREHLNVLGIPGDKITVSGIPIDPVFTEPKDQRQMRIKHGLEPDRTTILVSAGGFGVGPIEKVMTLLLSMRHPVQIVAICGRSEELRKKIARLANRRGPHGASLAVVGYTTEMDEYMAAADLAVGKPGGLTTSEALARGLVMVVVNPIPGQESRNADYLLEHGAAIKANNLATLGFKMQQLLSQPARLKELKENARKIGRPRAAFDIVQRSMA
jgi:processive 1,2-diacylglycerol beta-glucosyltransferase